MTEEERLLWMFKEVEGDVIGYCSIEAELFDEWDDNSPPESRVNLLKDGHVCWYKTKTDLMFDYLTKHLELKGKNYENSNNTNSYLSIR